MSTKKKEPAPEMILEKKEKRTDIQTRMETGKIEIMKVVEGVAGAEKLGELIELQGTGEGRPFAKAELDALYALAEPAIRRLIEIQKQTLGGLLG